MRVGVSVVVAAHWSSFAGYRGVVVAVHPHLMVHLEGDKYPMRFGDREVAEVETVLSAGTETLQYLSARGAE